MQNNQIRNQHTRNKYNLASSFVFVGFIFTQLAFLWQLEEPPTFNLTDFVLLSLAIFRLTRLFVYDGVTSWIRDLFLDISEKRGTLVRTKKVAGPERIISDIFSCPWCFSLWGGSVYLTFYLLFPSIMMYVTLIMAFSALATVLQIITNLIGHKAEYQKNLVEKQ